MSRFLRIVAALSLPLALFGEEPAEFVRRVYSTEHPGMMAGVPDGHTAAFFIPQLQALFRTAKESNAKTQARSPELKPFFADFNVFTPSPDAFSSFRVISSGTTDPRFPLTVIVEFSYDTDESHKLCDFAMVYLTPKEQTWQIADITLVRCHAGDTPISVLAFFKEHTAKEKHD